MRFFYFYMVYKVKRSFCALRNHYSLDLRSLALMRIGVSLVVICDLFIRSSDLNAFFSEQGIWPSEVVRHLGWQPGYWCFHDLIKENWFVWLVFSLHTLLAIFMLLGYKTRMSTFLVWVFTVSLHNRNLFILQAGDDLLRLTLFWGILLPWGNFFSIDSIKKKFGKKTFSPASFGYLFLIFSVYFFTILLKNSSEWRSEGTAVYYALSLESIRLPLGDWLYQYPGLMKALTFLVYWIEVAIAILIFIPYKNGIPRLVAFLLIIILHIGIGLTIYVGLFYIISITTAIGLIPSSVWKKTHLKLPNFKKQASFFSPKLKWLNNLVVTLIVLLCLALNLGSIPTYPFELDNQSMKLINVMRLNQFWGMFSPYILKEESWYVHEGFTHEGKHWDLYYNLPYIIVDKPRHLVKHYKSDRWRKLAENIQRDEYSFLRPLYCKYYLKKWNRLHPENKMESMHFIIMKETSVPNYQSSKPERILLCVCSELNNE